MKLTSYRSACMTRVPTNPQFKFDILLDEHFPLLIFFLKYFERKNWRGEDELLLKNGTLNGYTY